MLNRIGEVVIQHTRPMTLINAVSEKTIKETVKRE
jgi:hypothetical protein